MERELCPICKIREVEIDDLGYYGCRSCFMGFTHDEKMRALDQDGTGQDHEVYG